MKPNSFVSVNSCLTEESVLNCEHGTQSANTTFPVSSVTNPANIQPVNTEKLDLVQTIGSTSPQNSSMPPGNSSTDPSMAKNGEVSEADSIPDNKQANKNTSRWLYLPIFLQFLQFLNQQLTSQLPLFFCGAIGLVVVAMLISQASGSGIKLKLDLEVSPAPNQIEKASTTK